MHNWAWLENLPQFLGRQDDMLVIRGVNVFPSAVEELVRRAPQAAGEYQIVLSPEVTDPVTGYLTAIELRVETTATDFGQFARELADAARAQLGVRCLVTPLPAGTLPHSTHKSRRVVREDAERKGV